MKSAFTASGEARITMHSAADGFLARIREIPDDDGPRLIYADWLDEQGDEQDRARAEFIRVQIALARTPEYDPRRLELKQNEKFLESKFKDLWNPFQGLATGPIFRRGFIEQIKISASQFIARGTELFEKEPVRHVHLLDLGGSLTRTFSSPHLSHLSGLTIYAQRLKEPLARAIATNTQTHPTQLLHIGINQINNEGVDRLLASPTLAALEDLDLSENDLGELSGRAIGTLARFTRLRRLELAGNTIGPVGAGMIADPERFPILDYLGLARNRVGGSRLAAVAKPSALLRVGNLNLSGNGITPDALRLLIEGLESAGVRELDLSHNELGNTGAAMLAESRVAVGLRRLRLRGNHITDPGLAALAASPYLNRLTLLDVKDNPIGDFGYRAVLTSGTFQYLYDLLYNNISVSHTIQAALSTRFRVNAQPDE